MLKRIVEILVLQQYPEEPTITSTSVQSRTGPLDAEFEMTTIFGGNGEIQTFLSLRYFVPWEILPRNTPEFQDEDNIF